MKYYTYAYLHGSLLLEVEITCDSFNSIISECKDLFGDDFYSVSDYSADNHSPMIDYRVHNDSICFMVDERKNNGK